jgi:hypothetical protein
MPAYPTYPPASPADEGHRLALGLAAQSASPITGARESKAEDCPPRGGTTNTDFVFLNPTGLTLTLEYAFRQPARRVNCATDLQKTWFALNSLVEEDGFGPSIPREHDQR